MIRRFLFWTKCWCLTSCWDQTQTHIDDDEAFIDYRDKGSGEKTEKDKGCRCCLCSHLTIWSKSFFIKVAKINLHSSYILSAKYVQTGLGAYFRKKTISEEWIYSMSTSFSKCRRWNCDDVKPPSSVWWRPGCFDFPPNGVWTIFHGSSLLRSSSGVFRRHLQSPRKSPAYTHLRCEDS